MDNKKDYLSFCSSTYVPIYSKPWWLDAVCGEDNWDVWIYKKDNHILAAMPYYKEVRGSYHYITKAPLTQNNGIIFLEDQTRKKTRQAKFEEEIIGHACDFIDSLNLDVYEQQYQHSFTNWLPFSWRNYSCLTRYTYVIDETSDLESVERNFTQDCRRMIERGRRATSICNDMNYEDFYKYHELVFKKQGLNCPFSFQLWERLYYSAIKNNSGSIFYAKDKNNNIHAILFLVWDERYVYHLLGGSMPEYSVSQAYAYLTYHGISIAHKMGLSYDFEGSMIERISKAFRRFGGDPKPYFRIRKIFNPEIIRLEAEKAIIQLQHEGEIKKCSSGI